MKVGVVIPVGAGRQENVRQCVEALCNMAEPVAAIQLVLDGHQETLALGGASVPIGASAIPKHHPGQEPPRNVGVRKLLVHYPDITHAWFVDSDVLVAKHALSAYYEAAKVVGEDAILVGPYEWMPPGTRQPMPELHNDPRWQMFWERGLGPFVADLGVALGNFSGNLIWPVEAFRWIGGFWPGLTAGRVDDGELGLRAASHRIPMALVQAARGYHLWHPINHEWVLATNAREVPEINRLHPWVESQGIVITAQDGARFEFQCPCGQQVNTLEMWRHFTEHEQPDLILPEGL